MIRSAFQQRGMGSSTIDLEDWSEFRKAFSKWWGNCSSKHSNFQHKLTKEPLWMDHLCNYLRSSWIMEELVSHGLAEVNSSSTLSPSLIWGCCKNKDLGRGISIHNELRKKGLAEKNYSDALVTMYAKCGEVQKAQALLDMHNSSSIIPWNALLAGYAREGKGKNALDCFNQMQHECLPPSAVTFACVLKACALTRAIDKGKEIHGEISRQGLLEHDVVLGNALVDMYAKCGALCQAQSILKQLRSRDVVSWSALISGYALNGQGQDALDSFEQMQGEGILPDEVTYVCILQACAVTGAINKGKKIHDEISRQGLLEHSVVLGGALVDMYANCGDLCQAQSVLEKLPSRDVISWSALISKYAQNGQGQDALNAFEKMQHEGILPDEMIYVSILQACAVTRAIEKGKQIHNEISRQGLLGHNNVLTTALVDMYAKCGDLRQAQSVLEKLSFRNVIVWNALISGYAQNRQGQDALDSFEQMQHEGILPNAVTYVGILQACAVVQAIKKGKYIHSEISRQGLLEHSVVLGGALVDMYANCGALRQAQCVLETLPSRDVVSWNALISGFTEKGQGQDALDTFEQMHREGLLPNAVTYVHVLQACAVTGAIDKGKQIHDEILRQGLLKHNIVLGNTLVDMYAKCGALHQAQRVLDNLPSRDVISWSALILGYAENGEGQDALDSFEQMQREGILPNAVTYMCILQACAVTGAIHKGKQIHDEISRQGLLEHNLVLANTLVCMYAKCGALRQAQTVLEKLSSRDIISWTALILGHAQNGQNQQALDCFERMQEEGILPDEMMFTCLLKLCGHLGLVDKGQKLFDSMEAVYGLKPKVKSFGCMVDLLGRTGHLAKAVEVIQGMPFFTNSVIWHCLLDACRKWVDVNVGMWAFEQAIELDKCDGAAYVLMVSIYEAAGMLEKAKDMKLPGYCSWIESKQRNQVEARD